MYNWLKNHNFPSGFRVLCYNCNSSIGAWGYCPHKDGSKFKTIKTLAERTQQSILNAAQEIYNKGLYPSMNMVSELAGVSKQVVCKYRKKMLEAGEWPCPIRNYVHRGESHPNSVLDIIKIKKVKKLISQGYSNEQIGTKMGVSRSTIRDIRKGITWKHV
jgi:predicted transcriptional regulator